MQRSKWLVLALAFAIVAVGCASRIEGETNTPPPPGGPKASNRHPPGMTDDEVAKAGLK